MNYFNIQPITLNVSPFETKEINAIQWIILNLPRNGDSANCQCGLLNTDDGILYYTWMISIPKSVLDLWLEDSVIDDYICSTDSRFIKIP